MAEKLKIFIFTVKSYSKGPWMGDIESTIEVMAKDKTSAKKELDKQFIYDTIISVQVIK